MEKTTANGKKYSMSVLGHGNRLSMGCVFKRGFF